MSRLLSTVTILLLLVLGVRAQTAPDAVELTRLLNEFLDGASRNDATMHDRFWAADLIYTGSSGRRIGKADIMRDTPSAASRKPAEPATVFTAEDVRIQQYGNTAIVAFRLVGTTQRAGKSEVAKYFNTGTFVKRDGKWQAVGWQATRIPRLDDDAKKEVAETDAAFQRALLAADFKTIESLTDESFIWVDGAGEQVTRQRLLNDLTSGQLKYSTPETKTITVAVYGDSAVVRRVLGSQRPSISDSADKVNGSSSAVAYTLTFVNKGSGWKAVAMHSSRH